MKTYGTENNPVLRSDNAFGDCHTVKASKRNLGRNSDGDMHNTFRNTEAKARARRTIKRQARAEGKAACRVG